jgi:hypothetical protein
MYAFVKGTLIWYAVDMNKPMKKVGKVDAKLDENTDTAE